MKSKKTNLTTRLKGNWYWLAGIALSVAVVVLVALPARRSAGFDLRNAEALEAELLGMASWAVDGESIESAVSAHSLEVERRWQRLFPSDKGKGELFLDLARIADGCGVREFYLAEDDHTMGAGMQNFPGGMAGEAAPSAEAPPMDDGMTVAAPVAVTVASYTIRTRFEADLRETARFIDELDSIERAMKIREIIIREARDGLVVEMEMELYVSTETRS